MPVFVDDTFDGTIMPQPILSIGYCGHTEHGRKEYINALKNSNLKTDFILREGFWAPELKDKVVAKNEEEYCAASFKSKDFLQNLSPPCVE